MKKHTITILFAIITLTCASQSIRDLDFLIGKWEVNETIYPGTEKEYTESGVRTCEYYLDDSFIKCEASTVVNHSGKKRTYAYYINYDDKNECFWATNFANDFHLHGLHQWFLDEDNHQIIFITPKNVNGNQFFRGSISYADESNLIWNGWSSRFRSPDKDWKHIFS